MSKMTSQNSICLWDGKTKEMVVVLHEEVENYKHLPCSDLCCCSDYQKATFAERQLMLSRFALYLIMDYDMSAVVVHNTLMKLHDYRKGLHFELYDRAGIADLFDEE